MTQFNLIVNGDSATLTKDGVTVYSTSGSVQPPNPPVDPPPNHPDNPTNPAHPNWPVGPVVPEGQSAWFKAGADYFTIYNVSQADALEIALGNLNEQTTISVFTPDGRLITNTFIGGGSLYVRNGAPPGPYAVCIESLGIGVVKYWRR